LGCYEQTITLPNIGKKVLGGSPKIIVPATPVLMAGFARGLPSVFYVYETADAVRLHACRHCRKTFWNMIEKWQPTTRRVFCSDIENQPLVRFGLNDKCMCKSRGKVPTDERGEGGFATLSRLNPKLCFVTMSF
jgi:hypothetical protein